MPAHIGAGLEPLSVDLVDSPVGRLLVGASATAVHVLEFTDPDNEQARIEAARKRFATPGPSRAASAAPAAPTASAAPAAPGAANPRALDLLVRVRQQLNEYFAGQRKAFDLPLRYAGSPFQQRVWAGLLSIGYGETLSYLDLARRLGDEKSLRAVGQANGQNPIAIVIPCHRVIGAGGALTGYGGGLGRKRWLLDHEARVLRGRAPALV